MHSQGSATGLYPDPQTSSSHLTLFP